MTTYNAIEKIISKKLGDIPMLKVIAYDAYAKNLIDGFEYEELMAKAERVFSNNKAE